MVAVNPRFTLLAFSLASLSLAPPAAAAAIDTRSSDPGSPSKLARQLPMPMKLAARDTGKHRKQREDDAMSKGSKFHKSRVAGETVLKRQQEQAHFDMNRVTRRNVEARQDPCTPGYVDITSPTGNSTDGPTNSTTIGHLFLNSTSTPWVLDASQNNMTNLCLARSGSDNNSFMLQMPIDVATQNTTTTYCATYNPNPPAPEPLTMEQCGSPSTPGASQAFLYNNATREIQPMWFTPPANGTTNNGTASAASADTVNDEEVNDSDDSSSLRSRDAQQHVTLVFVPNADVDAEEVSPSSESSTATMTATVTTTVTATAAPSFAAADVDTASSTSDSPSQSTSTTSSDDSSATPSFAAADFDAASSTTDVPSQAPPSPSDSSLVSPTSSDDSTATASFVAAGVDAPSSQTDAPSPTDSSLVSATSSDDSTATPSFVPADVDASTTPTPTSSDSSASTVAALDVEVASASTSTDSGSASTDTVAPTAATSSSSDSSVPSATASTVDIAADIANSSASSVASSTSAAPSPSSSADAVVPPTSDGQEVYVGNPEEPRSIAAPYRLAFRAEPRL
ncbi:hypothetical protein B0H11DRAFT_2228072 [Mycena galericulata]|nr:hypothetical protein B0H11DRAFT_2228072 [Mycena galericulata]